jgi:hypothetical protein
MFNLCRYKHIFGDPGTGIHSIRVFDIAIIHVFTTLAFAYLFSYFLKIKLLYCIVGLFLLGILCHRIFCVRTTVDKWLFS